MTGKDKTAKITVISKFSAGFVRKKAEFIETGIKMAKDFVIPVQCNAQKSRPRL